MKGILKNYQRRLLNLGSSNRALLLLRMYKEMHLDMQELDYLISSPAFSIIQHLIAGKKRIIISPYADSRYAPVAPASRRLRQIRRKDEMIFEERGSQELYVGWPFVRGKFQDGTLVRSPLLFFPVRLQVNAANEWELVSDRSQSPHFNQSFLLAYAHYTGAPVAEALMELDLSTLPPESVAFRTRIYELLKENKLAIHVGRDFFADRLKSFRNYTKSDYEEGLKPGLLHLEQEAVLGIYPQAASFLLSDYEALLEQGELQEMEDLFTNEAAAGAAKTQAQHTFTVFDLDASQEAALQQVKQGKSMVVQGPPGTGKSQLICNLVSDFTARGKKVLVVSQKRAALDVVYQRLSSAGLGPFAALVHDLHADQRNIYKQLWLQIEQLEEYRRQNLSLNSIYTDRIFLEVSRGINKRMGMFEEFKRALFDTSRCGWSPKELYLKSSLSEPHLLLSPGFKKITADTLADFLPRLRKYLQSNPAFRQPDFVLRERLSFSGWDWPERRQLEKNIEAIPEEYRQWQQAVHVASGFNFSLEKIPQLLNALPVVMQVQELIQQPEVFPILQKLVERQVKTKEVKQYMEQLRALYMTDPIPNGLIPEQDVPAVQAAVAVYKKQRGQLLRQLRWQLMAPEKKVLEETLAKYNWSMDDEGVAQLEQQLTLRQEAASLMASINTSIGTSLLVHAAPEQVLTQVEEIKLALEAYTLLQRLHHEKVLSEKKVQSLAASLPDLLVQLLQYIKELDKRYHTWLQWLPATQVKQLVEQPAYSKHLLEAVQQYFEELVAYDTLYTSFSEAEREVAEQFLLHPAATVEESEQLFLNSLYLAWIQELEQQEPVLRLPSGGEIDALEQELQQLLEEKARLSKEIVLSKLREQVYANMEYNRLGNAVTYRRLQAQVAKKRSLYPIRKLLSLFQEEVLRLVPCWLASPETVSAVMPLEACFDLVIFDEASQCYAETGIPSIVRGKQVVVVGDGQQLKPSDLYRTRWSPEEEDEPEELSAESLLQLCTLYLPQTMLMQHYRSRLPELIDFSNRYFYKGKLELMPNRQVMLTAPPAIQFLKVRGIWQHNSNQPEAARVVALLLDLLGKGHTDIGVITFNYNQQQLVLDMLEEEVRKKELQLPPALVVKNIENMQGDEKEIIVLSVGYAPDEKGKLTAQFGSLNQAGGENRLNVAITRARQQVLVVSSIYAEDLNVEATQHAGPKLLKEYLRYARQVSDGKYRPQPRHQPMAEHYILLKDELRAQLPALVKELPFADLTFQSAGQYKGVVLTDDDLYYNQTSVRHAHADTPNLLHSRHWPYLKVYSRQYWYDAGKVIARLQEWEEAVNVRTDA